MPDTHASWWFLMVFTFSVFVGAPKVARRVDRYLDLYAREVACAEGEK